MGDSGGVNGDSVIEDLGFKAAEGCVFTPQNYQVVAMHVIHFVTNWDV